MSKAIRPDQETQVKLLAAVTKLLTSGRLPEGKLSFSQVLDGGKHEAHIYYSPMAWVKQCKLLDEFNSEVAWHGVARRGDDPEKNDYFIDDIVVYPQTVSGATVTMDENSYAKWLTDHFEDERFEHLYMQGHSHVNMATSPSAVDLSHQADILEMLDDDGFYIFSIYNKHLVNTNKIYDLRKNLMFEDSEIKVSVQYDEDIEAFIKEAKEIVKPKTYATTPTVTTYTNFKTEAKPAAGGGVDGVGDKKKEEPKNEQKKEKMYIGAGWSGHSSAAWDDDDYEYGRLFDDWRNR